MVTVGTGTLGTVGVCTVGVAGTAGVVVTVATDTAAGGAASFGVAAGVVDETDGAVVVAAETVEGARATTW